MNRTKGRKKDRREHRIRRRVERRTGLSVEAIHGLDRVRRVALQGDTLWTATRATIVLMGALGRLNRRADVQTIVEDLRGAARRADREGAVVFAADRVLQALDRGEDLQAATAEALACLRRLAVPPVVEERLEEPETRMESLPAPGPFYLWLKFQRIVSPTERENLEITIRHARPFHVVLRLPDATLTLHGEAPGTRPGAAAPHVFTSPVA